MIIIIILFFMFVIFFSIIDAPYRKTDVKEDEDLSRYKKLHDSWNNK